MINKTSVSSELISLSDILLVGKTTFLLRSWDVLTRNLSPPLRFTKNHHQNPILSKINTSLIKSGGNVKGRSMIWDKSWNKWNIWWPNRLMRSPLWRLSWLSQRKKKRRSWKNTTNYKILEIKLSESTLSCAESVCQKLRNLLSSGKK